jgi:hypothetical protein
MGLFIFGILFGGGLWLIGIIGQALSHHDTAAEDRAREEWLQREYARLDAKLVETLRESREKYGPVPGNMGDE